ncbi:hypothetical protein ABK249_18520 [Neorhizobium sp. Rsf11]|uniref:Uncharacterized protein n=2 Tax=Neorhizobium TaxID=1525371 RepID=A0ABV0M4Y4_9HYPH|nr:hypothetical protein [Neorhizobium petrolearium]MCC2613943.1 hypothetical protein [Neorhizobium petrolearium]WGI71466.1 hypothetical protein QEO92_29480 [Neorhizobium petrolearium]
MGEQPEANPMKLEPSDEVLAGKPAGSVARVDETGRVSWTIPLEISVQIPALATTPSAPPGLAAAIVEATTFAERAVADEYRDRSGYKRGFLTGFDVCNIDGANAKSIDRKNKIVTPLTPDSAGLEVLATDAEADSWR